MAQARAASVASHVSHSRPIAFGVKDPEKFLSSWKFALNYYFDRTGLPKNEMAIFEAVNDNVFDFGKARGIHDDRVKEAMGQPTDVQEVNPTMNRD